MSADTALEVGRLYVQLKRIADVITVSREDAFVRLPGLRAYWPMGVRNSVGAASERSGNTLHALEVGAVPTGYDGDAYASVGTGVNYFGMAGALQVSGAETFIDASIRGLTVGCWFSLDVAPTLANGIVSKYGPSPQYGYVIWVAPSGTINFTLSGDGTTTVIVAGSVVAVGEWHFIAARFIPSTEVAVFIDGSKFTNTVGVPATAFNSSQQFEIGRYNNADSRIVDAKIRDVFLCASALTDEAMADIFAASTP